MGFISDLKELSTWIISITCLVIILVLVFIRVKKEKTGT